VTGRVVVGADEGGGAAEERVGTGRDDDGLGLAVLAGRAREALVALLLVDGERLAGEGGLVHRDVDRLGKTAVGGADVAVLERDEVTGDEGGRLQEEKGGEVSHRIEDEMGKSKGLDARQSRPTCRYA